MKVSLFLGAGASTNYGMPTTREFKECLAKRHAENARKEEGEAGAGGGGEPHVWSDLLSGSNCLDIEHVLLLADTVDALKKTEHGRRLIAGSGRLGRALGEVMRLGGAARREVFQKYAWDHEFDESTGGLLGPLVRMAMAMNGDGRASIFTTNYDGAVEAFCEGAGLALHDGFSLDAKTGRRVWAGDFGARGGKAAEPGAVRLYKLHGSLDWKRHGKHGILRIDCDGRLDSDRHSDILIHPSLADKKDEIATNPYETIHRSFREDLDSSDACVVVGFSFRDDPIAAEFRRFAEGDRKTLIAVGPDASQDVHIRILGRDPPDGNGTADAGIPAMTGVRTRDNRTRRAAVIGQRLTSLTADDIAARARSAIEVRMGLLPVHTLGACTECVKRLTIDDMEKHAAEHLCWREGVEALLLRIAERGTAAPWMLALARPDSALGDLERFLQAEWMARHNPGEGRREVKFVTEPGLDILDAATLLPDVDWSEAMAWCNDADILEVSIAGAGSAHELHEPVRTLAVGEKPPFE